jgi:hypothetical protein
VPTKWEVERAVLKSKLDPQPKLIMLVLNTWAEEKTAEIPPKHTPSLEKLAAATGLSKSTVAEWLNVLDAAGWIFRDRPTKAESLGAGRRTRYRLAIGDLDASPRPAARASRKGKHGQAPKASSPRSSTVRTADSPQGGQTHPNEGPHGGQSTVRTADIDGPHGGHNIEPPTGVLNPTDNRFQPPPSGAAPDGAAGNGALFDVDEPAPATEPGANTLLADWIKHCAAHNITLNPQIKARFGKAIKDLLDAHTEPETIQRALIRMRERGKASRPAMLHEFVVDVQNPVSAGSGARAAPATAVSSTTDLSKWKKGPRS